MGPTAVTGAVGSTTSPSVDTRSAGSDLVFERNRNQPHEVAFELAGGEALVFSAEATPHLEDISSSPELTVVVGADASTFAQLNASFLRERAAGADINNTTNESSPSLNYESSDSDKLRRGPIVSAGGTLNATSCSATGPCFSFVAPVRGTYAVNLYFEEPLDTPVSVALKAERVANVPWYDASKPIESVSRPNPADDTATAPIPRTFTYLSDFG